MKTKIEIDINTKKKINKQMLLDIVCWALELFTLEGDKDYKVVMRK